MSKILIITNKNDLHADAVIECLELKKEIVFRLNTEDVLSNQYASEISDTSSFVEIQNSIRSIKSKEIKSIWYRKPIEPEPTIRLTEESHKSFIVSETQEALEGLYFSLKDKLWVNPFWKIRHASNKLTQLNLARTLGFKIPSTLLTNDPKKAKDFLRKFDGNIIYKTLYTPVLDYDDHSTLIQTQKLSLSMMDDLDNITHPCLFQEAIEKEIELRVTVVGEKVFAAEIHSQELESTKVDWRQKEGFYDITYKKHTLPPEIQEKLIVFLQKYGLVYGAFDFILTPQKEYVFLENNPNGEWLWIQIRLGMPIREAISDLLSQNN